MLTAQSIRQSFGASEVLRGVSWAVPPGSRWGLVGPNGSGKTTLLRILAGDQEPAAGTVEYPGRTSIAYLPQEGGSLPAGTLLEAVLSPFTEIARMETEIHRLQHELADAAEAGHPAAGTKRIEEKLGDLMHRFEAAGGFRIEAEAKVILGGLGFQSADPDRDIREFSGGYRTRALLGSLLLRRPDYLLMDEPTNHLDLEGIHWLEEYLREMPSAIVVVSHDRFFLNRAVDSIAELERGTITVYRGSYDHYRTEKATRRAMALATAAREEKKTAEVEKFVERFRYKATKARQVQDRIRMLEKQEKTVVPEAEIEWGFRLQAPSRGPAQVLEVRDVVKGYGGEPVLRGAELSLIRGDRVALVGPNGCGKTTLLRLAAGELTPDAGVVRAGDKVIVRYVAQHLIETLSAGSTVLGEIQAMAPSAKTGEIRSLLGIFQFSGDDVFKDVATLSGGEKNRLALARLALQPGHLLLLDEPTNHLDLAAREALEEALDGYDGAVLFVSHDRYFINRVAKRVVGFDQGRIRSVDGGYDDYLAWLKKGGTASAPAAEAAEDKARRKEERRESAEARNARNRGLRKLQSKVKEIEKEIARREARVTEIRAALGDGETYAKEGLAESLGREEKTLTGELGSLYWRWEEASRDVDEYNAGS
jgi:ATP-binding cassette subfamily F protein 3